MHTKAGRKKYCPLSAIFNKDNYLPVNGNKMHLVYKDRNRIINVD